MSRRTPWKGNCPDPARVPPTKGQREFLERQHMRIPKTREEASNAINALLRAFRRKLADKRNDEQ